MHKLAILGFGTVGQGLAEILLTKENELEKTLGFSCQVVAISDVMKGSIYDPNGLDIKKVLEVVKETGNLEEYPDSPSIIRDLDSFQTIEESNADTVVEATFTDVQTGQPAIDHCKAAFRAKKNVVMSNKGPVALAFRELSELAKENRVRWGFEGTVMSGTPALRMPLTSLAGNEIKEIRGILNGTTNYMLTQMEEGLTYEKALKEAQALGYAEADPTSDVEGYDARYKAVILANTIMNSNLAVEDVDCSGISHLTLEDIEDALGNNKRYKLIATIKKENERIVAKVGPIQLPMSDPLAAIEGATNAITFDCDLAGPITLVGAGAGRIETGYSLLIDLINIERNNI